MLDPDLDRIAHAPWSAEEVAALAAWQACGWVHPFTCGNRETRAHDGEGVLVPTPLGWTCPACIYHQNWAFGFMLKGPPPDPLKALFDRKHDAKQDHQGAEAGGAARPRPDGESGR